MEIKNMTTTFESANVGDRVYSIPFGWGEIREISEDSQNVYYIHVYFENHGYEQYTLDGYFHNITHIQSLFWDEVYIKAPAKPIGIKVINGVEIPDISFKPTYAQAFLYPSIDCISLHQIMTYNNNTWCRFAADNGLCYPYTEEGRNTAILHAKAMLGIKE
jgi:hypothetical protein